MKELFPAIQLQAGGIVFPGVTKAAGSWMIFGELRVRGQHTIGNKEQVAQNRAEG